MEIDINRCWLIFRSRLSAHVLSIKAQYLSVDVTVGGVASHRGAASHRGTPDNRLTLAARRLVSEISNSQLCLTVFFFPQQAALKLKSQN